MQRAKGLEIAKPITVVNNVWIGANVSVLPGVTIGSSSIIGAGSVVNKDIPEGVIAAGNPCKVIRKITYEQAEEELPEVGTYSVILFDNDEAACIIRDVKVSVVPFDQVSAEHAYKEGEDDRSLEKWQEVHRRAFTPDYAAAGLAFDESGECVLEGFEVVWKQKD